MPDPVGVCLRAVEITDAALVHRWIGDDRVNRGATFRTFPWSERRIRLMLEKGDSETDERRYLIIQRDSQPIGLAVVRNINWKDRNAEVGIIIGETQEWGKGYGSKALAGLLSMAFDTLGMHRIYAYVLESNEVSERLVQRLGFRREGTLRQCFYRDGRFWDASVHSILEDEWRAFESTRPA